MADADDTLDERASMNTHMTCGGYRARKKDEEVAFLRTKPLEPVLAAAKSASASQASVAARSWRVSVFNDGFDAATLRVSPARESPSHRCRPALQWTNRLACPSWVFCKRR